MESTENNNKGKISGFLKKNLGQIIGIVLGIVGGYLYYLKVGCSSGSCAISSNVWLSMAWGAAAGYLISGMFTGKGCCCGSNISNHSTCEKK